MCNKENIRLLVCSGFFKEIAHAQVIRILHDMFKEMNQPLSNSVTVNYYKIEVKLVAGLFL